MNPTFLLLKEAACNMTLLELRALAYYAKPYPSSPTGSATG